MKLATAWQGSDAVGSYTLRLQNQPTLQPTKATVTVHVPQGTHISFASEPLNLRMIIAAVIIVVAVAIITIGAKDDE